MCVLYNVPAEQNFEKFRGWPMSKAAHKDVKSRWRVLSDEKKSEDRRLFHSDQQAWRASVEGFAKPDNDGYRSQAVKALKVKMHETYTDRGRKTGSIEMPLWAFVDHKEKEDRFS